MAKTLRLKFCGEVYKVTSLKLATLSMDQGYRMREIAKHLVRHYTISSRAIKRVENFRS